MLSHTSRINGTTLQACGEQTCTVGARRARGGAQHGTFDRDGTRQSDGTRDATTLPKRPSGSAMRAASRHAQRKRKKTNAAITNERNDRDGASCNQSFADPNSSSLAPPFFGFCGPLLRMWGGHKTLVGESGVRSGVSPQMRPQIKVKGVMREIPSTRIAKTSPGRAQGDPRSPPRGGDRTRSLQRGPLQLVPLHVPQCPRAIGTQGRRWRSVGAKCDTGVLTRVMRAIGGKM